MAVLANKNTRKLHEVGERGESCEQENLDAARAAGHLSELADHEEVALMRTAGYTWCKYCHKEDDDAEGS